MSNKTCTFTLQNKKTNNLKTTNIMDTIDIVFNIMMGLPGSGKTYFCTQSNNHLDCNTQHIC